MSPFRIQISLTMASLIALTSLAQAQPHHPGPEMSEMHGMSEDNMKSMDGMQEHEMKGMEKGMNMKGMMEDCMKMMKDGHKKGPDMMNKEKGCDDSKDETKMPMNHDQTPNESHSR